MARWAAGPSPMGEAKQPRPSPEPVALRFGAAFAGWSLVLFAVSRLPWVQAHVLLPLAAMQQRLSGVLAGPSADSVLVDASCTGTDVLALCAGAILAYPAPWAARLRGAAWSIGAILALNVVRLGTISLVADRPRVFDLLHVYVWPALLVLGAVACVAVWMRQLRDGPISRAPLAPVTRAWLAWTGGLVALYFLAVGWLEGGALLQGATSRVAAVAGGMVGLLGVPAAASGSTVLTPHGAFLVTTGCIASPLIPVYLATVITLSGGGRRLLGLVAAVPVFFGLGVARLLVLALPGQLLPSPQLAIHAFHQVLIAVAMVAGVGFWWRARETSWPAGIRRALLALGVGAAALGLLAPVWEAGVVGLAAALQGLPGHGGHAFADEQGAFAMLPVFQLVLLAGLCAGVREAVTRRRAAVAVGALAILQAGAIVLAGELAHHLGFSPHVGLVRAWGIAVPAMLAWILVWPRVAPSLRGWSPAAASERRPAVSWPTTPSGEPGRS